MFWLDMGLGKTIITLSIIKERLDALQCFGIVIFAPLRVCQTVWRQEAKLWSHTQNLTFSLVHGTVQERELAILRKADIYLVNYENIVWFVDTVERLFLRYGKYPPFNMIVYDEISKMKNSTSKRHKAIQRLLPYIPYRIGLTGTPASNGYIDLYGQYLALDSGHRLGISLQNYKDSYFKQSGYHGPKYDVTPESEKAIQRSIADITLQMASEDYLDLPPVIINDIHVDMPKEARILYDQLEEEFFFELDNGVEIEVFNAAAKTNKCLQFANGAVYQSVGGDWAPVHQAKLEALDDIIEEAAGTPILCFFEFQSDVARLIERYPEAVYLKGGLSATATEDIVQRWNRGEIQLLLAHPASAGHGLNLQYGSNIMVWFGLNWSLDLYEQAIARLARQGQTRSVMVHRLLTIDTLDYVQSEALRRKANCQQSLRSAIQDYRSQKYGIAA